MHAARARLEAVRLNRAGDYEQARLALRGVARRIRGYAGNDTQLRDLAQRLAAEEAAFTAPMPEMSRKAAYFASANVQRARDVQGRARPLVALVRREENREPRLQNEVFGG